VPVSSILHRKITERVKDDVPQIVKGGGGEGVSKLEVTVKLLNGSWESTKKED